MQSVLLLCTFKVEGLGDISTYPEFATYYRLHFTPLDTAMRRIYTAWLNEPSTLRPLQEHYTILNNVLLTYWFDINDKYIATQKDIVVNALSGDKRTAVIVCDGLRLEIAEVVVNDITDKNVKIERNTALSVLPSVTENGMSALFGCSEPTMNAQSRYNILKSVYDDVVIMPLNMLNDGVTANRLVLNYGDIDEVGEKKQLGALKDITNYEPELREKIAHLFRLGYNKIVLTTDHGFVLTGLLDEADKEPRPAGNIQKIEERFVLTEEPLSVTNLIERAGRYFNSSYQYYAKTDKPFKTTGRYGYSHGGFTPQECVIPAYELNIESNDMALRVMISNKMELKAVTGNYFTVKLLAEGCESDLFRNERKVKLLLYAGSKLIIGIMIELDSKLLDQFKGYVVRKDVVRSVKGGANVPVFVLEYLLANSCSTDDEEKIQEGIDNVKRVLRDHYVNPDEATLVQAKIREQGTYKIIDKISVRLDPSKDKYWSELSNLAIRDANISEEIISQHEKMMTGGIWAIIDMDYDSTQMIGKKIFPFVVSKVRPIQLSSFEEDWIAKARSLFNNEEWLDVLLRSGGYEPESEGMTDRMKMLLLSRFIPLVESNFNMAELGPRSSGKSFVFKELSPTPCLLVVVREQLRPFLSTTPVVR